MADAFEVRLGLDLLSIYTWQCYMAKKNEFDRLE